MFFIQTPVVGKFDLGIDPELRLTFTVVHMDVCTRFFSGKEKEAKTPLSKNRRTHARPCFPRPASLKQQPKVLSMNSGASPSFIGSSPRPIDPHSVCSDLGSRHRPHAHSHGGRAVGVLPNRP